MRHAGPCRHGQPEREPDRRRQLGAGARLEGDQAHQGADRRAEGQRAPGLVAEARQLGGQPDQERWQEGDGEGEGDDRRAGRALEHEPVGGVTEDGEDGLRNGHAAEPGDLQERARRPSPLVRRLHGGTLPVA
jgi:hypothetical protein